KEHLKNIDHSASQLNSLIGDILDVAKLQEGRMSFKLAPLDVSESLASVVDSFMKPAQDKSLALSYTKAPLPLVSIDPDRFRQVAINLVGNAIKYTPKGEVRVTAKVEGERVSIRVSDTGMGISAEEQKSLFQKFYRVKNEETREITGTGLGLWITSQIVKQMAGTIGVESIKGKGTDFIISFPVVK
ncbi:MAG: HAMP domain-containing sensor histidine kinase, partial [bacterium]|nr:HAMP domain-containing sensor histidine kinase [bacterium]